MVGFIKYYELLLQKAAVDYRSATVLYKNFQNGDSMLDLEVILFHLQQAAEKCLKSLLSFNEIHYPKIHDLEVLLNMISENKIPLEIDNDRIIELSDFAVEGRYSVLHDDLADVEKYFKEINLLLLQTKKRIPNN